MCGRLLSLWHASYGYRGKAAGRDKGKLGRLMSIGMYVCMYVCIFIKLHITAQSGPVIYSFYATACNPPGGYLS